MAKQVLTSYTRKELPGKVLDLAAGERHEAVALEEVKDALSQQIRHDANVISIIETIPQVDALVSIGLVVGGKSGQYPQLDPGRVPILLDRTNDLDRAPSFALFIIGLHHLSKRALSKQFDNGVWERTD